MSMYRGRFAPTPSGPLHFGSMVAAIGSYCDARANAGRWQVRIDDVDTPRVVKNADREILRALEAFGMEWDDAPIYQGRRHEAYALALDTLTRKGLVFRCACTRKEIDAAGIAGIEGMIYHGCCRNEVPPGRTPRTHRLRVDEAVTISFHDILQGHVQHNLASTVGDFVLRRADGVYAYHLACVVDDADQGITHVVRGADLIDSTPRQIFLQQLLGLSEPQYFHLPVATNRTGEKLSKQTRAAAVTAADSGEIIHAVLAFLGQQPPAELRHWTSREAIAWAVKHWKPNEVPRTRGIDLRLPYQST